MLIEVYTDGSATTNDKPGGYGWVIIVDGQKYSEGSGYMPLASNNDAELEAALKGLSQASLAFREMPVGYTGPKPTFTLVSDSQLILGWADGSYAFRQHDKIEKYKQLQLLVKNLDVKTRWVEGHSGDEHNERCDKLANEARLQVTKQTEKAEAILTGKTLIGHKKIGVVCMWYKNCLKIMDLQNNIVENYDRTIHGTRGSILEVREDKNR